LLIYFFFCWLYRFGNWFQVIIPAYPIFVIGVGSGLKSALRRARWGSGLKSALRRFGGFQSARLTALVVLLLGGLVVYRLVLSWPRANQHDLAVDTGLHPGWAVLADRPALPATVVAAFEERVALQYLQTVWQLVPGLVLVEAEAVGPAFPQPEMALYITRQGAAVAPGLVQHEGRSLQAAGEQLIALHSRPPHPLPASAYPLSLDFGGRLRLIGWEMTRPAEIPAPATSQEIASPWQIAFYWQSKIKMDSDYTISVRPLAEGQLIMQAGEPAIQDHQPVWGLYPTSRWHEGEVVRDVYALALPETISPDGVQVVVYRATAGGFENLGEQVINFRGGR
jgi:hypothetical protein